MKNSYCIVVIFVAKSFHKNFMLFTPPSSLNHLIGSLSLWATTVSFCRTEKEYLLGNDW